jgi:hypothetical protein
VRAQPGTRYGNDVQYETGSDLVKLMRIYCDTSVFGGCVDAEFQSDSRRVIGYFAAGRATLLVSAVILKELADAPDTVRKVLDALPAEATEPIALTEEAIGLRDEYLAAGVVGPRWADDATHVALATIARADAIVSWNFRHMVRLDKMRMYNKVNLLNGYGVLTIISPTEVRLDDLDTE